MSVRNVNFKLFEVLQLPRCRQVICLILILKPLMMKEFCCVLTSQWRYHCHVSWQGVMASHVTLCDMCPVMVSWSSGRSHCKQEADVYAWENINDTSSPGARWAHSAVCTTARTGHYTSNTLDVNYWLGVNFPLAVRRCLSIIPNLTLICNAVHSNVANHQVYFCRRYFINS